MTFLPRPVQQPRIPIWVVGAWPSEKSMRRAARYDGLLPAVVGGSPDDPGVTPDKVREMAAWIEANRDADGPFDIVVEGTTPGDDPVKVHDTVRSWAEAGATWWLESNWEASGDDLLSRIRSGPPRT